MQPVSRRRVLAALGTGAFGFARRRDADALAEDSETFRALVDDAESVATDSLADESATFGAWLTGANERPPVATDAFGFAVFAVAPGERAIDYWLVVADVENVAESHIHKGPPDLNGNVVAYLFGPAQKPVTTTGPLASGRLTDDAMIWPLTDVAGMVEQMRAANVYVNVHTTAHPAGEIRGQIRPLRG
ncbi:CHRD domain-containing protein [Halorussus caseinilyticus]|uniref:CHRD domain-containing protein n=1 Tax=Halorussus caseinilyticus TaxID=3034025 RepID=A0ABD5WHY2_9EURY|nr:CHRD domain-containing protein [Halorussus sp. DT72]